MDPVCIDLSVFRDHRGSFCKTWHPEIIKRTGIEMTIAEEFHTISGRDVIRGMHFQTPPHAQRKLVCCPIGSILDVILDLRTNSPTYGHSWSWELSGENCRMVFIPEGFAHGFQSLRDDSLVLYRCSAVHAPTHDRGIRWDSFGFKWPCQSPVISDRDVLHERFENFKSPFES